MSRLWAEYTTGPTKCTTLNESASDACSRVRISVRVRVRVRVRP